jgi:hypothetical protein
MTNGPRSVTEHVPNTPIASPTYAGAPVNNYIKHGLTSWDHSQVSIASQARAPVKRTRESAQQKAS